MKFARLQHEMATFIFVADLHAITVWQEPAKLTHQVREIAAAYLAAGLDPQGRHHLPPVGGAASTPSWPGSSTASPASAGSTG